MKPPSGRGRNWEMFFFLRWPQPDPLMDSGTVIEAAAYAFCFEKLGWNAREVVVVVVVVLVLVLALA